MLWRHCLTAAKDFVKELFVQLMRLFVVHPGKRSAGNLLHAQMIKLLPMGLEVFNHIPQACSAGKLADHYGHELRPVIERSKFLPDVMLAGEVFKFMSLEKTDNLIQYCVTMGYDSDLLVFIGVLANSIYHK